MIRKNIQGQRFGRLIAIEDVGKDKNRNRLWLCKCDCGGETVQGANTLKCGLVKSCGCYQSEVAHNRMLNEGNPFWSGDNYSLGAVHSWVRIRKPKPSLCEKCGEVESYDLANISGEYKRNIDDYQWLCRTCHMTSDGRMFRRGNDGKFERIGIPEHRPYQPMQ